MRVLATQLTTFAACLALGDMALGDIVILKNGNEIQGEILNEEGDRLVVKFPGGILELERKQVGEIRRQSRSAYLLEEAEKRLRRGEMEEAVSAFEQACREDPSSEKARQGLLAAREGRAEGLADSGRYEDALAAYRTILAAHPAHVRAGEEVRVIDQILAEARKEEERGKGEIAAGDMANGIWRLQGVCDRFPERRRDLAPVLGDALIREADSALSRGDLTKAEELYSRALGTEPELVERIRDPVAFIKGRQIEGLLPAGDFAAVQKLALEGLEIHPTSKPLRYYLGVSLEAQGRPREAVDEYVVVTGGNRPRGSTKAVSKLREEAEAKLLELGQASPSAHPRAREVLPGDFRELRVQHFVIRHKNLDLAREVAFVAQKAYGEAFRDLGCGTHLRSPMLIHIHANRQEYAAAAGSASWSGGAHRVERKMGVLSEHRIDSYQEQPRLLTGVLQHEIGHALLAHRLNYPDGLPLWANEGFAIQREPAYVHRYYRKLVRHEAGRRALFSLNQLCSSASYPEGRVDVFYAQSFSLTEFLISLEGLKTFLGFLKAVSSADASLEPALRRHYGIAGVAALENRWRGWLDDSSR